MWRLASQQHLYGQVSKGSGQQRNSNTGRNLDPTARAFNPECATILYADQLNQAILLQTAQATLWNPKNGKEVRANVILDLGSQRSYVTRTLANRLHLRAFGTKRRAILTFGSAKEQHENCELVKVIIVTTDDTKMEAKLLVIPLICETLNRPSLRWCVDTYPHLKGLQLADTDEADHFEPEVLIGSDFYWELITAEMILSKNGPKPD